VQTISNIIEVRPSNTKPQFTTNNSEFIHGAIKKLHVESQIATSNTINIAIKADNEIAVVETKQEPEIPIKRPNKKQEIKLKKGKIIMHKYIKILTNKLNA